MREQSTDDIVIPIAGIFIGKHDKSVLCTLNSGPSLHKRLSNDIIQSKKATADQDAVTMKKEHII